MIEIPEEIKSKQELLLKRIEEEYEYDNTIIAAVKKDDLDCIKEHLNLHNINKRLASYRYSSLGGVTLLQVACYYGKLELVKYFVENGAIVDLWYSSSADACERNYETNISYWSFNAAPIVVAWQSEDVPVRTRFEIMLYLYKNGASLANYISTQGIKENLVSYKAGMTLLEDLLYEYENSKLELKKHLGPKYMEILQAKIEEIPLFIEAICEEGFSFNDEDLVGSTKRPISCYFDINRNNELLNKLIGYGYVLRPDRNLITQIIREKENKALEETIDFIREVTSDEIFNYGVKGATGYLIKNFLVDNEKWSIGENLFVAADLRFMRLYEAIKIIEKRGFEFDMYVSFWYKNDEKKMPDVQKYYDNDAIKLLLEYIHGRNSNDISFESVMEIWTRYYNQVTAKADKAREDYLNIDWEDVYRQQESAAEASRKRRRDLADYYGYQGDDFDSFLDNM